MSGAFDLWVPLEFDILLSTYSVALHTAYFHSGVSTHERLLHIVGLSTDILL